jgi:hypothetical protein
MNTHPQLQWTTFVLSRRIAASMASVELALADGEGILGLDEPFRLEWMLPRLPAWRTTAQLATPRGRRVARVELEITAWSSDATELVLRPLARHPERWGKRRLRRYFALAHGGIDHVASVLAQAPAIAGDRRHTVDRQERIPSYGFHS